MKILLPVIYLLAVSVSVYAQEVKFYIQYPQDMEKEKSIQGFLDLMGTRRFFEAFEYYEANCMDTITEPANYVNFLNLYYNGVKNSCFNQQDTAIVYFNQLLDENEDWLDFLNTWFLYKIMYDYEKIQSYEEAIDMCDRMIYYYYIQKKNNALHYADNWNLENAEKRRIWFSDMRDKKRIEVNFPCKPVEVPMDTSDIIIPVKYNGAELNTIFDTGLSTYLFMTKEAADKAKATVITSDFSMYINDTILNIDYGVVDSIAIGDIELKNIPVFILKDAGEDFFYLLPDSIKQKMKEKDKDKEKYDKILSLDVFLGLPTMNLLGNICMDFDAQKMIIGKKNRNEEKIKNLLVWDGQLFLRSCINGADFTGFFDTGNSIMGLTLTEAFYNRNRDAFKIDTVSVKDTLNYTYITEYKLNAEYEKIEKITFKYGDKQYDIDNESIILLTEDRRIPTGILDGTIGAGFLKKLRKVHFDFKNMVFYPEE